LRLCPGYFKRFGKRGKWGKEPCGNMWANTCESVVERPRYAGLETCEPKLSLPPAGLEACATWACVVSADFTVKYHG